MSPGTTPPTPAAPAPVSAPARPEYVPESHWDATAGKIKDEKALAAYVNEHVAFKAAEDSKRLSLPADPTKYELKLPDEFKAPAGIEFKPFDAADPVRGPVIQAAREWALKNGLTQSQFSELLGFQAAVEAAGMVAVRESGKRELDSLGAAATGRIDAVNRWVAATYPGAAKAVASTMVTRAQVEMFEGIMQKLSSQGGAPFSAGGRTPPDMPGRVDGATYEKMTFTEKKEYAAKFPQTNGAAA